MQRMVSQLPSAEVIASLAHNPGTVRQDYIFLMKKIFGFAAKV